MLESEYIWLELTGDISIEALTKLKKIYINEYRIYLATFCPSNFRRVLIDNDILLPKDVFKNMISLEFKEYTIRVSQALKEQGIELIGMLQKGYPQSLREHEKCPVAIYLKSSKKEAGLKNIFMKIYKLYMLESKNEFNKEILGYIWAKTINKKKKKYMAANTSMFDMIETKKIEAFGCEYIGVCKTGDIEIYILNRDNRYVDKEKLLLCIIDGLIVGRVSNTKRCIDVVDFVLEGDRDIFAVPGNILYKENYLANHLIKQGAYIVTNRYDMEHLI